MTDGGGRSTPCPTAVIGLGNPLRGDDGVGVRLVEALGQRALPADVEVLDGGTQGLGLVTLLEGRRRAILVDAAEVGRAPGQFVRFRLGEARLPGSDGRLSIHDAGMSDALRLAEALGVLPEEVIVFGVQPAAIQWDRGLSPEVEAALPRLLEAVLAEIAAGRAGPDVRQPRQQRPQVHPGR